MKRHCLRGFFACLCAGAFLWMSMGAGPAPESGPTKRPITPMVNPHLHVAPPPQAAPVTPHATASASPSATEHASSVISLTQRFWGPRLDTRSYITEHRGLAVIRGVIHNANNQPERDVRVALRKPGGRIFANVALRHITHTGADGEFVMKDVRPGTYRVFASINKKKGFVKTEVHADSVAHVSIKL